MAGIYSPNKGNVEINGSLTPFIELGVGFNPELTGRENVFLNGALLGFNRETMFKIYDEIVEFAELERFMDQKLKNYSSGMQVRLAFSIAIRAQSDILLLDEVLAVGDYNFQKKCFKYFTELKNNNRTVIFVSHDMASMTKYCDKVLYLESGNIKKIGKTSEIVEEYMMDQVLFAAEKERKKLNPDSEKQTTKALSVKSAKFEDNKLVYYQDDKIVITAEVLARRKIEDPIIGIVIYNNMGQKVFESNTLWKKVILKPMEKGDTMKCTWELDNNFTTGEYPIDVAVASDSGMTMHDVSKNILVLNVQKPYPTAGIADFDHIVKIVKE